VCVDVRQPSISGAELRDSAAILGGSGARDEHQLDNAVREILGDQSTAVTNSNRIPDLGLGQPVSQAKAVTPARGFPGRSDEELVAPTCGARELERVLLTYGAQAGRLLGQAIHEWRERRFPQPAEHGVLNLPITQGGHKPVVVVVRDRALEVRDPFRAQHLEVRVDEPVPERSGPIDLGALDDAATHRFDQRRRVRVGCGTSWTDPGFSHRWRAV